MGRLNDDMLKAITKKIYPAPEGVTTAPEIGNDEIIERPNESRLAKALLARPSEDGFLVVIFHGNGSTILNEKIPASYFYKNGLSVLLVEYPGYGMSSQYEVSEKHICSDAECVVKHVQTRYGYDSNSTILYGRSLGSGPAIELARKGMGGKLVLLTPISSLSDYARIQYPDSDYSQILEVMDEKYDNLNKAKEIKLPVLILHGNRDPLVPITMSFTLKKSFSDAKLITLDTDKHRDIYDDIDEATWSLVRRFICS